MFTKTSHLFVVSQVPLSLTATGVSTDMMAGPMSSGPRGAEPLVIPMGVVLVCIWSCLSFMSLPFLLLMSLNLKGDP
jgi:hypothetical protein